MSGSGEFSGDTPLDPRSAAPVADDVAGNPPPDATTRPVSQMEARVLPDAPAVTPAPRPGQRPSVASRPIVLSASGEIPLDRWAAALPVKPIHRAPDAAAEFADAGKGDGRSFADGQTKAVFLPVTMDPSDPRWKQAAEALPIVPREVAKEGNPLDPVRTKTAEATAPREMPGRRPEQGTRPVVVPNTGEIPAERWNTPVQIAPIGRKGEEELSGEEEEIEEGPDGTVIVKRGGVIKRLLRRLKPAGKPSFKPRHLFDFSLEKPEGWGAQGESGKVAGRMLWLAVFLLLTCVACVFKDVNNDAGQPSPAIKPEASATEGVDQAKAAILAFCNATTLDQMKAVVRHPDATLPRMKAWYARHPKQVQPVEFTQDWFENEGLTTRKSIFLSTTVLLDGYHEHDLYLEQMADGSFLIDWEHMVQYSEMPWAEFLQQDQATADFRLTVSVTDYYLGEFTDKKKWISFRLADGGNTESCTGYAPPGSPVADGLLGVISGAMRRGELDPVTGMGIAQVRVKLQMEPGWRKYRQAVITEILRYDWLEP